ncbi:hypothetical protein [Pseudonocardia nigra]|uniref:hypothetical protein n=1 Tax=Pseudonocardia nigra TaxID=1921578 RepID=UPI001C5F28C3|nr:hypothetical protein [Pseudonocardia nigra]
MTRTATVHRFAASGWRDLVLVSGIRAIITRAASETATTYQAGAIRLPVVSIR